MKSKVATYIFSYNRCDHLKNCYRSSMANLSHVSDIFVVDDNSSDKNVMAFLNSLSDNVLLDVNSSIKDEKVGGLVENMQAAMNHAKACGYKYVIFIQDDTQVVRKIASTTLNDINSIFSSDPNILSVHPCFMKRCNFHDDEFGTSLSENRLYYTREPNNRRRKAYSDIAIYDVERFFCVFNSFEATESLNEIKALSKNLKMAFMVYPFVMWLPMPRSSRSRKRSYYHKLKEKICHAGFYPYQALKEKELLARDVMVRPYAEDYLIGDEKIKKFKRWSFTGIDYAFYELGGWRKIVGKILIKIQRMA